MKRSALGSVLVSGTPTTDPPGAAAREFRFDRQPTLSVDLVMPARSNHPLADVARLPVREVVSALHFRTDLTLGLGTVAFDYLAK